MLVFFLVSGASRAIAQTETPPAEDAPPVDEVLAEQARAHFLRGVELYAETDYEGALIEFNRAHEILPRYQVLFNIGAVRLQLQEYVGALDALSDYLAQGGEAISPDRRAEVELEAVHSERMPGLVPITPQAVVYRDPDNAVWVGPQLLKPAEYNTLTLLVNRPDIQIDETRGQVHVLVSPCPDRAAQGVRMELAEIDEETVRFYVEDGLPTLAAEYTDAAGLGGFFNAAPGIRSLTATRASDGKLIGRTTFLVRAGWATFVVILPLSEGESL